MTQHYILGQEDVTPAIYVEIKNPETAEETREIVCVVVEPSPTAESVMRFHINEYYPNIILHHPALKLALQQHINQFPNSHARNEWLKQNPYEFCFDLFTAQQQEEYILSCNSMNDFQFWSPQIKQEPDGSSFYGVTTSDNTVRYPAQLSSGYCFSKWLTLRNDGSKTVLPSVSTIIQLFNHNYPVDTLSPPTYELQAGQTVLAKNAYDCSRPENVSETMLVLIALAYGADLERVPAYTFGNTMRSFFIDCVKYYHQNSTNNELFSVETHLSRQDLGKGTLQYNNNNEYAFASLKDLHEVFAAALSQIDFATMNQEKMSPRHLLALVKTLLTITVQRLHYENVPETDPKRVAIQTCFHKLCELDTSNLRFLELKQSVSDAINVALPAAKVHRENFSFFRSTKSDTMLTHCLKLFADSPEVVSSRCVIL